MSTVTRSAHVDAVLAALNSPDLVAYSLDGLPSVLPPYYLEVTVSRRYGGVQRAGGPQRDGRLWRITVRAVGKTLANANLMWERAASLEDVALSVSGAKTTPVEFELENPVAPDAGWYSGITSWTYAAT